MKAINPDKMAALSKAQDALSVALSGINALMAPPAQPAALAAGPNSEKYRAAYAADEAADIDQHFVKAPLEDLIALAQQALGMPSVVDAPDPAMPMP